MTEPVKERFKGTLLITDPWYVSKFSAKNPLFERSTIYGDWSCTVFTGKFEDYKDEINAFQKKYSDFWEKTNFGEMDEADKFKLHEEYTAYKENFNKEHGKLGEFCADTGMVAVFDFDALRYANIAIEKYFEDKPWLGTIIKDFDGVVSYEVIDKEAHIIGEGNINFFSVQTGF